MPENEPLKNGSSHEEKSSEQKPPTAEILDKLPPEARKMVEMSLSMASISGPMLPPFLKKINEEHISKVLELSDKVKESLKIHDRVENTVSYMPSSPLRSSFLSLSI